MARTQRSASYGHPSRQLDRLREIVERRGGEASIAGNGAFDGQKERMRRLIEELEAENAELKGALENQTDLVALRDDEKEDLNDQLEALRLEVEDLQRRREMESIERSESRAQILEEREEREVVVDNLNGLRDKLAAVSIELQQKEDEISFKSREIDDLVFEHRSIIDEVETEWKGEVEDAKAQIEELKDVSVILLMLCWVGSPHLL